MNQSSIGIQHVYSQPKQQIITMQIQQPQASNRNIQNGINENKDQNKEEVEIIHEDMFIDKLEDQYSQESYEPQSAYKSYMKSYTETKEKVQLSLRRGQSIIIDWNTKTNFKSKSTSLNMENKNLKKNNKNRQIKIDKSMSIIDQKRAVLFGRLHQRTLKNHLQTKIWKQQEKSLFEYENLKIRLGSKIKMKNRKRLLPKISKEVIYSQQLPHTRLQMEQNKILKRSKLTILKHNLERKFIQIQNDLKY